MFNKKKKVVSLSVDINENGEINFFIDWEKDKINTDIVAQVLFKMNTGQYKEDFLRGIQYYGNKNQDIVVAQDIMEKYIYLEQTYSSLINENKYLLDKLKNNTRNPVIPPNQALDVLKFNL